MGKMRAEHVDERTLPYTGHTGYSHANGIAGVRQALLQNILRELHILRMEAFDQGDGLAKDGAVAAQHALDISIAGEAWADHWGTGNGARSPLTAGSGGRVDSVFKIS